jgi:hypothetical protein
MSKYKDGKIYKLTSSYTESIYIGSTIQPLNMRLNEHRCKKSNNTNSGLISKYDDVKIELIENYPCNTKRELLERERFYIKLHFDKCVNIVMPCRTQKEYREDNKEILKNYFKKYRKENSEIIKERRVKYRKDNPKRLRQQKREYYKTNKESILQRNKRYRVWRYSFGGDMRYNNNLLHISMDLFH